jgi:hypothetical protein
MIVERTPAASRSMRAGRMLGILATLALFVTAQSGPAWAGYGAAPRGFEASPYADLGGSACGGTGPTGLGVAQSRMWAAADGRLLVRTSGSSKAEPTGSIAPWGIAPFRSGMYATQPGCDVVGRTGMPPDPGLLGTPCNVVHADGDGNEIAVVADVCGTAIALQPGTNWPTVATRDGRIVVIDPEEGAITLVGGLGSDPAMHLAWRGSTLYYARASGGVWVAGGGRVADIPGVRGLLAPIGSGLSDLLLVTTVDGAVIAVDPTGKRAPDTFGHADDFGGVTATGDEIGILVGHAGAVWRLDGDYEPLPPAPTPPPPAPTQTPAHAPPPPAAAPPPPVQAPPAAPPPPVAAAPAAPSTSVTQVVAAPGSTSVATSVVPGTATAQAPAIGLVPDDVDGEPQLALEGSRRRDPAAPLLFVPAAGILLAGAALQLHREQVHAEVAQAAEGHLVRERFGRAKRSRRSSRAW